MQQGELEHCWLPLGLCAVCSGDEQMLEESFISPLVSFFPPPGHPVSLETTLPCAELGYQCANPPSLWWLWAAPPLCLQGPQPTPSCLGCSRPCSENKAASWRQLWLLMFRECHRQPGNEPQCNPTSGSCIYIDPWKQFPSLAHHSLP